MRVLRITHAWGLTPEAFHASAVDVHTAALWHPAPGASRS
jgi:hypothetical protein